MLEKARFNWQIVDERAVETLEIGNDETIVLFLDLRVTARHGSVGDANVGRGLAANDKRLVGDDENRPF
jgi:hypothetical protein